MEERENPCKAAMVRYFQASADEGTSQALLFTEGKERAEMERTKIMMEKTPNE